MPSLVARRPALRGRSSVGNTGTRSLALIRPRSACRTTETRAIDIFGGAVLLAVTSPVIAAIAVAIRVSDGPRSSFDNGVP